MAGLRGAIVWSAGTWGIAGEAVPAASGVVASLGREGGAGAAQRGVGWWSAKRPYSARGRRDFGRTQGASKPAVPAGQLPEGARVIMPPGPCVPFPGAGGTFPPARRPAARSPSEAAVATRTPSGASARTIGIVGIKCQGGCETRLAPSGAPGAGAPALIRRVAPPSPASGRRVRISLPSPVRSMGEGEDEGWSDRIRSWPARGWGRRCRRGPWARRR